MFRKGELTSGQIIAIIISLAGFVVLLIFLSFLFEDRGEIDRETCRVSVLTRATAPTVAQASVPLKCATEKICISESGKSDACSQFLGEKNVRSVKLTGDDNEKRAVVEREIAEAMYFCWSMMGQGKLDLVGNARQVFLGSGGESACVVCSRVAFSDDLSDEFLSTVDVQGYMEDTAVPGSTLTYLETFTDNGVKSFASISDGINLKQGDVELSGENARQVSLVFSQVAGISPGTVLENLGLAVVAGAFAVPGSTKAASALFLSKASLVTVPLVAIGVGAVGFNAWAGQQAAAGYCGQFSSSVEKKDLKQGCSVVQVLPYNVRDVNSMCDYIEGRP